MKLERVAKLGAEVSGVDLSPDLPQDLIDEIEQGILEHRVIFFRDQDLTGLPQPPALHMLHALVAPEGGGDTMWACNYSAYESLSDKMKRILDSYNPDWAVLIDTVEGEGLYFAVETRGSTGVFDLCPAETARIKCGEAHFEALAVREDHARYKLATTVEELLAAN